jgi:hypothetical protein
MSLLLQIGHGAGPSFWQQHGLAVAGPGVTVLFGSWAINALLDRKRRKDADRQTREEIALEMSRLAATFYFELREYRLRPPKPVPGTPSWRLTLSGLVHGAEPPADANREKIDLAYRTFRVGAEVLETRIDVYFVKDEARALWHAVSDLLTVRYHDSVGELTEKIREQNADDGVTRHSGLGIAELADSAKVAETYKATVKRAIREVMSAAKCGGRSPLFRLSSIVGSADR